MSDTTPEMLDEHVLAQLEGQWRRLGATTPEAMEPGLSDVEIDEIGTPLGFVVPEEVRRLFRWHNGSRLRPFVACRTLIDLRASVQETVHHREKDEWWGPNWLKVMDEKPYIIFDCSGPCDAPVPVWHHDYEFGYPTRPVFPSIGEMFRFWINLMEALDTERRILGQNAVHVLGPLPFVLASGVLSGSKGVLRMPHPPVRRTSTSSTRRRRRVAGRRRLRPRRR